MQDEEIVSMARKVWAETGSLLIKKYGFDKEKHEAYVKTTEALAAVIAAALHFDFQEDKEACEVQEIIKQEGLRQAILKLTEIPEDSELVSMVESKATGF